MLMGIKCNLALLYGHYKENMALICFIPLRKIIQKKQKGEEKEIQISSLWVGSDSQNVMFGLTSVSLWYFFLNNTSIPLFKK